MGSNGGLVKAIMRLKRYPLYKTPSQVVGLSNSRVSLRLLSKYLCTSTTTNSKSKEQKSEKTIPKSESEKKNGEEKSEDTESMKKPVRGGPVSWLSLALLLMTGGGIVIYYDQEKKKRIEELKNQSSTVQEGHAVGKAAIGGPFTLLDQNGNIKTEKDFFGKWTLVYFGFTYCPDICPDELQKMVAAVDKIKEKTKLEIVPVFISVDPERDTVEQIHDYVQEFHPNLIGLTGKPEEIKQVARSYRVYYMKTDEKDSDYLVDHSIVMYLMSPKMEFVKFFGKNYDVDSLTEGIIKEIKAHK